MLGNCWETLANFESFELVKREYALRHGRTPNTTHARELAAPFTHARSYFIAARGADRTVKPLLLYYGVLSLSRGLTLALSRSKREAALGASHGLSIKDWGIELSKPNPDFARIEVSINASGSFVEVCNATANKSLLRGGSSAVNLKYSSGQVATGLKLSLGDVLARVPLLHEHFWRWQAATGCYPLVVSNSELHFPKNRPYCDRALCEPLLAGTAFQFASETASHVAFQGPNSLAALPGLSDKVSTAVLGIGELWLVALYPGGFKLSKLGSLFVLSYFLGMLVRYFPTQWTALIHAQVSDAALPTLMAAVDLVEDEFPRVTLDFLADYSSHQP